MGFELTWDLYPAWRGLGFPIRYYSMIFIVVFVAGWALFRWQIIRGGGPEDEADRFLPVGVIVTYLGGRLVHYLFYAWDDVVEDPSILLDFGTGGISSHGSVLGLLLGMWLMTRWRGVSFIEGCDRFAFSAALAGALVRIGNFFNSEVVGRVTDQTWGVRFPRYDLTYDAPLRHPSQLYEFGMGMVVFGLLFAVDRWAGKEERPRGLLISTCFVAYFSGRFLVEFFKEHQALDSASFLTMGQLLSLPGLTLGVVGLVLTFKYRVKAGWRNEALASNSAEN